MNHIIRGAVFLLLLLPGSIQAADAKYSIKAATTPAPKELSEPISKLLSDQSVQLLDSKGAVLAELWFRKQIPSKAGPDQAKKGLTYRDLDEGTLLGAIRCVQPLADYRKQKIKPGIYTLRLGFQPMNGDHMGTAPYPEFCIVTPAGEDKKPDTMDPKELFELSTKATMTSHPGIFLLFPNEKPKDKPELVAKEQDHWVLNLKEEVSAGGIKAPLGFALTLIGHSAAE
jgi:hypothetical protein